MSEPLTKVDSAVQGIDIAPPAKETKHRRASSSAGGVMNINDLEAQGIELQIAKETQATGWKINTSPTTVEDKEILKKMLTTPPVKKIDLHFPLGLEVTARNLKGVTIKDALDAIYKQFKKRADDELDLPYLAGFEWDKEESWTRLIKYQYQNGFDCYFETEAVPGALPVAQNSPQKPPLGLYAEKLSGTAFTAPRHENKQSWLYRILPACSHPPFAAAPAPNESLGLGGEPFKKLHHIPNQLRWDPFDHEPDRDFVSGLHLIAGAGDPTLKQGCAIYVFAAGRSMGEREAFYSADGELLIVPQEGALDIRTEMGWLLVRPMEICVIPRGVRYQVRLPAGPARGYALELFQGRFILPELGPIGSNGLANARDFQAPVASFEEDCGTTAFDGPNEYTVTGKFNNALYKTVQRHTPFDVVAWHGNYYPYKYDLGRFNTIGTISFDHPDPSIFTVLSAPSDHPGTSIADFVIFPPRWLVGEDTFRPPWYHRNTMSEFMGLIRGGYDAKKGGKGGFVPGGASLHNVMSGHGPDVDSYEGARNAELKPAKVGEGSCAFMFESCLMVGVTDWGLKTCQKVQETYNEHSWGGVKVHWKKGTSA
ncbi:homogentisate 1,2-dioxygenase-domain-containing protein [Achaetomium macrosporum]|uniref:homogentisate 1,2-dioxygenase n=1 Tax=Achaetomium macrosporum TaxID=79813 RepID=A0AAN7CAB7_9PEZI|nr:homogentisate 1,2-dioxygenase-domain-containing protein [Achaetomium macrosporum]